MNAIIKIMCDDRPGIVADVSSRLFAAGCNIIESAQFFQPDPGTVRDDGIGKFFMRLECAMPEDLTAESLERALTAFTEEFRAEISVREKARKIKTIVMVSRFDHCLQDALYRARSGTLPINVVSVVSNHEDARHETEFFGIPFLYRPVTPDTKAKQEAELDAFIAETGAELIVLARYMQIFSDAFSGRHFGRIINIHHSFLPAFKGAKPYQRAYDRGVKQIGATAHYVTADLDEGPIIEQDTERVTHTSDAEDLVRRGREIEARVLSRAIRLHAENRVFINGSRTVVFHP